MILWLGLQGTKNELLFRLVTSRVLPRSALDLISVKQRPKKAAATEAPSIDARGEIDENLKVKED